MNFSPSSAAHEMLSRRRARSSLAAYIEYAELGFAPAAHHRLMVGELEALECGETSRLMLLMPPGSGKSTYASAVFPSWYLGRHPEDSVIAGSHTQELADRFGRRVRNLYASQAHRNVFGLGVAGDSQAAGRWDTEAGGEYFAVGVGTAVSGRRADLGIIDDPVRGREDADSDRARERTWDWYVNDFLPRLKPDAAQVVVMTRWHEDDLGGRILQREGQRWRVVELAMEALPGDPLGRKPGERLWPEWYTDEMVETAKLDPRGWNALYQQQPAPEDGEYFKRDWFGEYDVLPAGCYYYGASDYAVTGGGGDYTEHGVWAIDALKNLYAVDWWRGQATADEWIERQIDLILRHKPQRWFGEAGPIRRSIEPFLARRMVERNALCRIEWLPSIADKPSRCRAFQALASMGKVYLPQRAPWRADLLGQLLRFPAGRLDDGVDVCSLIGRALEHVGAPRVARHQPAATGDPGRATGWMAA